MNGGENLRPGRHSWTRWTVEGRTSRTLGRRITLSPTLARLCIVGKGPRARCCEFHSYDWEGAVRRPYRECPPSIPHARFEEKDRIPCRVDADARPWLGMATRVRGSLNPGHQMGIQYQ